MAFERAITSYLQKQGQYMNEFDEYSFTMRNHGLFFISVALVVAEDVRNWKEVRGFFLLILRKCYLKVQ